MNDIDKLKKRMDDCVETLNEHWPASATVMVDAADTISAQQKRIEELEKDLHLVGIAICEQAEDTLMITREALETETVVDRICNTLEMEYDQNHDPQIFKALSKGGSDNAET